MGTVLAIFLTGIIWFLKIYMILLTFRVYLSWFANVNFFSQPFYSLGKITDPFIRAFRGMLPKIHTFDLSPLVAFVLLQVLLDIFSSVEFVFVE